MAEREMIDYRITYDPERRRAALQRMLMARRPDLSVDSDEFQRELDRIVEADRELLEKEG